MSELADHNLRRFQTRVDDTRDDGGFRLVNDARSSTPRPIRRLGAPGSQPFPIVAPADDDGSGGHVDDLIAGYALGALDPDEIVAVDRHAAYCPACSRMLAEHRRTAAMLPFVAAPANPSPDVKAALFARIAQSSGPFVAVESADDWARPAVAKRSVTLPASGSWLESLPAAAPVAPPVAARRSPRTRRSAVRTFGVAIPVLLTFSLLALFVVPRWLPSNDPQEVGVAELLSDNPTECDPTDSAIVASSGIASLCGFTRPLSQPDGSTLWELNVTSIQGAPDGTILRVNIPTAAGFWVSPTAFQIRNGASTTYFDRPVDASAGRICLTLAGEDPVAACPSIIETPAA